MSELFKKIISHCKEYGFIFKSSEIYDGLSAVYDYGPLGVELKNNIKSYWWDSMVKMHKNIVGLDSSIFMHPDTWMASGHIDAFNDPLIDQLCDAPPRSTTRRQGAPRALGLLVGLEFQQIVFRGPAARGSIFSTM